MVIAFVVKRTTFTSMSSVFPPELTSVFKHRVMLGGVRLEKSKC